MAYALRALDIDNTLAETHALLGHFRWLYDYDWPAVKRHVDRARELNPASPLVRVRYAMGPLLTECRFEEAIAEMEAAVESDPLSIFMRLWLAVMLFLDRQYDRRHVSLRQDDGAGRDPRLQPQRVVNLSPATRAG